LILAFIEEPSRESLVLCSALVETSTEENSDHLSPNFKGISAFAGVTNTVFSGDGVRFGVAKQHERRN
jgi:hypothetical protein